MSIELAQPSTSERAKVWARALGRDTNTLQIAERYPLAPALIPRAAEAARVRSGNSIPNDDDVIAGVRSILDDRLGAYARRVSTRQTWDDLVISYDQAERIIEFVGRIRKRTTVYESWGFADKVGKGLGVSALFSGPPGTGKTMCAGLIAKDLSLDLFVVDAAKITSKWIGETEKNLGALFDAAEAAHAIILFDEADALFGKRSDVKSSNDKHANSEVNYLLQRMETFTGICILTSNHETALDPAFQRRLSLHLRFDVPDENEREKLWRAMLPAAAPVATDIDFEDLARRFEMSGGHIRNAVMRAAFMAAERDCAISNEHMMRAARVESEALGRIVS